MKGFITIIVYSESVIPCARTIERNIISSVDDREIISLYLFIRLIYFSSSLFQFN